MLVFSGDLLQLQCHLNQPYSPTACLQGVEQDLQQVGVIGAVHDAVLLGRSGAGRAAAAAVWAWQPCQEVRRVPQLADGCQGDVQVLL